MAASDGGGVSREGVESAGRLLDQHSKEDLNYVELSGKLRIATHLAANSSGESDVDYPALASSLPALAELPQLGPVQHTPLPPELLQEFDHLQCNCAMGLMPEIRRAWLSIDSNIYLWNYEDGKDLAYFDGLNEVILSVGLIVPRPGVFQQHIQFLLCLTTAVEIVILGVRFTATLADPTSEMHLQPDPLFNLPTDNVNMLTISGSPLGRIFLGGKDGCLYEVVYQAEDGWFSRKCRKVNHSLSRLSFLVPSFLSFSEEDPLVQIVIDGSRHILYTRSQRNAIQVYDLGSHGDSLSHVASISMDAVVQKASYALRTADQSLLRPLVHLSVLPSSESSTLHLLAITQTGVRLYFTTTPDGALTRPSLLALVHARLPPGFSPSSSLRPGSSVHQAFYRRGTMVLSSAQSEERDLLWLADSASFPFQGSLIESHLTLPLEGRTWAIAESIEAGELEAVASLFPLPPAVVSQHVSPPRRLIMLTAQGSYLVSLLRPVDQLQSLLEVCKGPSSKSVEAFFKLHNDTQACAMCLILATGPNQRVANWAAEAFFKYGGEPHFVFPTTLGPSNLVIGGSPTYMQSAGLPAGPGQYATPPSQLGQGPQQQVVGVGPSYQTMPSPVATSAGAFGSTYTGTPIPSSGLGMGPGGMGGAAGGLLGRAVMGPEVQLSGKHNGLCRYLARLLRPLWDSAVAVPYQPQGVYGKEQLVSRLSPEQLAASVEQMQGLRSFIEKHPELFITTDLSGSPSQPNLHKRLLHFMRPDGMPTDSPAQVQQSLLNKYKGDAYLLERSSMQHLYQLVVHCCECLLLWKLVCEYQFHLTADGLSDADKNKLKRFTFKYLVVSGKQLTSALISSLLNRYAGDSGLSDTLSGRLRDMTPSLFSHSDAIASKAQELVTIATALESRYDQLSMLRESLKHFSQVTHQISLASVCQSYKTVRFYEGIVELALCSATHKDPKNLGLHFYKSGQPQEDAAGQQAFVERQQCYTPITNTLTQLLEKKPAQSPVPSRPGPPSPKPDMASPAKEFEEMLSLALRSNDELFHITLYSWLISSSLGGRLIEIHSPFVEDFLKYTASIQRDNLPLLDLLWKYYEKNRNYSSAAHILDQLAHREGPELSLDQRIEYLSRAVMCAKSCNLGTSASTIGEFLHELEEKMEVARIQLGIVESLRLRPPSSNLSAAVDMLNGELMDITKLYGDFAEPYHLAECKLAIVHCAGHYDPMLVESLWREIVTSEVRSSASTHGLQAKLLSLGQTYARSERFFPIEFLVQLLEQLSCQHGWEVGFVHQTLHKVGVSLPCLFATYDQMFKAKDPFWQSVGRPLHVLASMHSLLSAYTKNPTMVAVYERASFNTNILDAITRYLVELQTTSSTTRDFNITITNFRALENLLQRMAN